MRSSPSRAWLSLARGALSVVGGRRLTILIYHRVHRDADVLFPGIPDARRFDEEMGWLAKMLRILPLSEAIDMHREGRLPSRAGDLASSRNTARPRHSIRRHSSTTCTFCPAWIEFAGAGAM